MMEFAVVETHDRQSNNISNYELIMIKNQKSSTTTRSVESTKITIDFYCKSWLDQLNSN